MESYIRSLQCMGQSQNSYGSLVPIVIDKLPGEIRKNMAQEHGGDKWSLADLPKAIKKELKVIEAGKKSLHSTYVSSIIRKLSKELVLLQKFGDIIVEQEHRGIHSEIRAKYRLAEYITYCITPRKRSRLQQHCMTVVVASQVIMLV